MKKITVLFMIVYLFCQCGKQNSTNQQKEAGQDEPCISVDFGQIKPAKMSDVMTDCSFIKLETNDQCLIKEIGQIAFLNDKIYILDYINIYEFDKEGKYIKRFENRGNGPGEFLRPSVFYVDPRGFIVVFDLHLRRLLKYDIAEFKFIEEITLPYSIISFSMMTNSDLYIYYCYNYQRQNEFVVADKNGNIQYEMLKPRPSSILQTSDFVNIYHINDEVSFYVNYSNKIYTIKNDTLSCRYELSFGKYQFPDDALFQKHEEVKDILNELYTKQKDVITFFGATETTTDLLVRYFVNNKMYIAVYNKQKAATIFHFKAEDVKDDLGFGVFPDLKGVHNNQFVGELKPDKIHPELINDKTLKEMTGNMMEDDNPILVLYTINGNK